MTVRADTRLSLGGRARSFRFFPDALPLCSAHQCHRYRTHADAGQMRIAVIVMRGGGLADKGLKDNGGHSWQEYGSSNLRTMGRIS